MSCWKDGTQGSPTSAARLASAPLSHPGGLSSQGHVLQSRSGHRPGPLRSWGQGLVGLWWRGTEKGGHRGGVVSSLAGCLQTQQHLLPSAATHRGPGRRPKGPHSTDTQANGAGRGGKVPAGGQSLVALACPHPSRDRAPVEVQATGCRVRRLAQGSLPVQGGVPCMGDTCCPGCPCAGAAGELMRGQLRRGRFAPGV